MLIATSELTSWCYATVSAIFVPVVICHVFLAYRYPEQIRERRFKILIGASFLAFFIGAAMTSFAGAFIIGNSPGVFIFFLPIVYPTYGLFSWIWTNVPESDKVSIWVYSSITNVLFWFLIFYIISFFTKRQNKA